MSPRQVWQVTQLCKGFAPIPAKPVRGASGAMFIYPIPYASQPSRLAGEGGQRVYALLCGFECTGLSGASSQAKWSRVLSGEKGREGYSKERAYLESRSE
jgi:hypothetical protein